MTEELFRHPMVEVWHGHPLVGGVPPAPGTKGMDMRMKSSDFAVCTTISSRENQIGKIKVRWRAGESR